MGRILLALLIFFAVLFGGFYLISKKSHAILSTYLSHKLDVKAHVDSIDFHAQGFTVRDFKIRNPKGAYLPYALKIDRLTIHAPWINWARYNIDIDLVDLDTTYVSILFPRKKKIACNWVRIFKSFEEKLAINRIEPVIHRHIDVNSIRITDLTVDLKSPGKNVDTVGPIKEIADNNIDLTSKASLKGITEAIVHEMILKILSLDIVKSRRRNRH